MSGSPVAQAFLWSAQQCAQTTWHQWRLADLLSRCSAGSKAVQIACIIRHALRSFVSPHLRVFSLLLQTHDVSPHPRPYAFLISCPMILWFPLCHQSLWTSMSRAEICCIGLRRYSSTPLLVCNLLLHTKIRTSQKSIFESISL